MNRESITIDLGLNQESLQRHNLKRSISIKPDDFLKVEDINLDNNFEAIENNFSGIKPITKTPMVNMFQYLQSPHQDSYFTNKNVEIVNTIGPISTLEYLVQSTNINSGPLMIRNMQIKIKSLRNLVFRWRRISGDGNCFYRAIIFSYLENLIFEKKTSYLKQLCIEIDRLNPETNKYIAKIQDKKLRDEYTINKNKDKSTILNILFLIIDILEENTKDSNSMILKAFQVLYKSFIIYQEFDYMMVKYLRYALYVYMDLNKTKIYHKEYEVKLGNLIPIEYEKSEDVFDFQKYFEKELLPLYKDAEMASIHLVPFVLKVDLVVLTYDFTQSSVDKSKLFSCYLNNKQKINVIYRNSHYDLFYDTEYFERYTHFLSEYSNLYENENCILSDRQLAEIDNLELGNENEKVEIKRNTFVLNHEEKVRSSIVKDDYFSGNNENLLRNNLDNSDFNLLAKTIKSDEIKKSYVREISVTKIQQICFECKKKDFIIEIFNRCQNCISREVKTTFSHRMNHLFQFSKDKNNINKPDFKDKQKVLSFRYFVEMPIILNSKVIALNKMNELCGLKKEDILKQIKSDLCVNCLLDHKDDPDNYEYSMKCGCSVLSKKCEYEYLDSILIQIEKKSGEISFIKELNCFCSEKIFDEDLSTLYRDVESFFKKEDEKLKSLRSSFSNFENDRRLNNCCSCGKILIPEEKQNKILVNQNEQSEFGNFNIITQHSACDKCFKEIKTSQRIQCKFCIESKHENFQID